MIMLKSPSVWQAMVSLFLLAAVLSSPAPSQTWRDTLQYANISGMGLSLNGYVGDSLHNSIIETQIRSHLKAESLGHEQSYVQQIHSIFVVTSDKDTGQGTLRKAMDSANVNPGLDLISFDISPSGQHTITPLTFLPNIVDPVIIDGTSQTGAEYSGQPMIELNCSVEGAHNAFTVFAGNSTIRGFIINRLVSGGSGIVLDVVGNNIVEGCFFGTDNSGTSRVGNIYNGVISNSATNRIGGLTPQQGNIFVGQGLPCIGLGSSSYGTLVQGNFIGTDFTGSIRLGTPSNGIAIVGSYNDTIGGSETGARNIISGCENGNVALGIVGTGPTGTRETQVLGNYIGTDVTGTLSFGNTGTGVLVRNSPNNVIGGTIETSRNIISGNRNSSGILIDQSGSTNNIVQGNFIGTKANGIDTLGNSAGITIKGAPNNTIGGTTLAANNVIAGNYGVGITLWNSGASGNKVQGNSIGTDLHGGLDLGNESVGVYILDASQDTLLFNLIAHNRSTSGGVFVSGGTRNFILGNSIYSNAGLGIDLAPRGVTKNDSLDTDAGANNLQNFPLLDSARAMGGNITVHGRFNGKPNTPFHIHFYSNSTPDSSHFGEGETYLNAGFTGGTNDSGNANFVATFPFSSNDQFITATATDSDGNTSEFTQALCLSDSDGDGIMDSWETQGWGIDVNSDGIIDLDLFAMGAKPTDKDIFVEVDAMTGMAPQDSSLQKVIDAFAIAGNGGINLHITKSDTNITPVVPWASDWWESFRVVKTQFFGTKADRDSSNARFILEAKKLVYRYCIFAYQYSTGSSSGLAEPNSPKGGDDFMVTLGTWPSAGTDLQRVGTFMHELGHTLGLRHGGGDEKNYKPNYISIMNYSWQVPYKWANTWRLDYSPEALPTLYESSLNEHIGLNAPVGSYHDTIIAAPYSGPGHGLMYAKLKPNTWVDWDSSNSESPGVVSADLNIFADTSHSAGDTLVSQEDWSKLIYNFRNSPNFSNAQRFVSTPSTDELDFETFQFLDNLPPPKPSGQFVMDGVLDTSATLVASNAGINLYASYKSGQLYVATNSAQSQSADMFIFISDARNPLRAAPLGKSGQVAGWSAFLWNESSDNSSGWSNAAGAAQINFTAYAVDTVLEGVIDVEFLYGRSPTSLFIAVGKYGTNSGGAMLVQVPVGNGDGNIDPGEIFQFLGAPAPNQQFLQQGNKLVGTGGVGPTAPYQGHSVSVSADGNTAIVGGYGDNISQGASWIFTHNNGVWAQQGNKLVGTGNVGLATQGIAVSISSDGNTAIIGGPLDDDTRGAAWVFTRSGGVWTQQGNKLVGSGGDYLAQQGSSVAISGDGNTAIVGAPNEPYEPDNGVGAVYIFVRVAGVWAQQGRVVGSDVSGGRSLGFSVGISYDGNTAIAGGPFDDGTVGAAWVFTRNGGVWTQQGNKLVGTDMGKIPVAGQGFSVAISGDGNTAIVGGPYIGNDGDGAAWVFARTGGVWTQQAKLVGTGAVGSAGQGWSVSISADGNMAIVGGPNDNSSPGLAGIGAAWVFTRSNGTWTQLGDKLVGTGAAGNASQGFSVSMSADGNTVIAAGTADNAYTGASWVFMRDVPLPIQLASFTAQPEPHGHGVLLDWVTLSEINNYGFEAQRSDTTQQHYQSLPNGFIPGHGTTNEPQQYSYVDSTVTSGVWYYRLKQIDLDGAIHYSDGVRVNVLTSVKEKEIPTVFSLSQNYPNPWNPTTTIRYGLPHNAYVMLTVYNILGQEVAGLVNAQQEAGYHDVLFRSNGLSSGVYFYRLNAGNFTSVKKLLLLR